MRTLAAWWLFGAMVAPAAAAEPEAPPIELLLYLADWEQDASGQFMDPLDLPLEADADQDPSPDEQATRMPITTEHPR